MGTDRAAGYRIRQASHADLTALADMKVEAWRQTYGAIVDPSIIERQRLGVRRTVQFWERLLDSGHYLWLVVSADDRIVGVAGAEPARDAGSPASLELTMIYLLQEAQGSGIADRLLQIAIGDAPAYLWVLDDNPRAQAFYRRHGFVPDGTSQPLPDGWRGRCEIRMVRRPEAEED
ncbi:MAG TPA: GNAT family N-acetyltransferase [Propionibacteriaceae bacterium]|nr:GNAT family N-acetyltransferase [Propionibacteriaceae bacterium]